MQHFLHFSVVFCLYTALHNQKSISSNFLVFPQEISLRPATFLLLILSVLKVIPR